MIDYELRAGDGILVIRPQGSLEAADFQRIAAEVDPYLEAHGKLQGVMIEAKAFPGWKDFAALVAHRPYPLLARPWIPARVSRIALAASSISAS